MSAELHQRGLQGPVDMVIPNTSKAEAYFKMVNKQLAGYLYHVLPLFGATENVKCYLINKLLSMIINGQNYVFLFRQGTEQPHQGDMNTRVAIPNTSKEVHYQIRLDPEVATVFF